MKKILFSLLIFLSFITYAQEKWDYPIKPRTEEWKNLENHQKRLEVCQIPESVLQNISTNDLMILCLQYPFLSNVLAFNNMNAGLDMLFINFNGIREFSKRENVLNSLREQYLLEISAFPEILKGGVDLDIGYAVIRISTLEVLLSCKDFHNGVSKENQKKILESLLFGYREKIKYSKYFRGTGFTTNLFARANVIIKIDPALTEKFDNSPVLYAGIADGDTINTTDSLSYNLIK